MITSARVFVVLCVCCIALGTAALAAGPVDGEFDALWWSNDMELASGPTSASADGSAPGYRAELWLMNRYGFRASQFSSAVDDLGGDGADYTSVDVMWRALAPAENNYLAVGLGWQQMKLDGIGMDGNTSGMRLSLEGRIGIMGQLFAYGQGSYLPSLGDTPSIDPLLGRFEQMDGMEYELGVGWRLTPFLALRAGYRAQQTDFTLNGSQADLLPANLESMYGTATGNPGSLGTLALNTTSPSPCGTCSQASTTSANGTSESSGFFLGLGVRF